MQVWDARTGQLLRELEGHETSVTKIVTLTDDTLLSSSWDKSIRIWNFETGVELKRLTDFQYGVGCLSVASDFIVAADFSEAVICYDKDTFEVRHRLEADSTRFNGVSSYLESMGETAGFAIQMGVAMVEAGFVVTLGNYQPVQVMPSPEFHLNSVRVLRFQAGSCARNGMISPRCSI